jgi:hypothetical protein
MTLVVNLQAWNVFPAQTPQVQLVGVCGCVNMAAPYQHLIPRLGPSSALQIQPPFDANPSHPLGAYPCHPQQNHRP